MPHTLQITAYTFDELTGTAKANAIQTLSRWATEHNWWEAIYDDWQEKLADRGIDINQKAVKLMNGSTRFGPAIYFSGFSSQGDGACFAATINLEVFIRAHKLTRDYWPLYLGLRKQGYSATITPSGRYSHEYSTDFHFDDLYSNDFTPSAEAQILDFAERAKEICRDYMREIYSDLEKEYDYLTGEEELAEMAAANRYSFDSSGNILP